MTKIFHLSELLSASAGAPRIPSRFGLLAVVQDSQQCPAPPGKVSPGSTGSLAFFPSSDELRRALLEWARSDGVAWVFVFKALLTASLALWLAYRLELPQPSTVLVTVFIVMQTQSGRSWPRASTASSEP